MAEHGRRPGSTRRISLSRARSRTLTSIVSLALLLGFGASDALGAVTWSGTWSRDEEPGHTMTLVQTGNSVTGTYTWSKSGTISKGKVTVITGVVTTVPRLRLEGDWNDGSGLGPGRFVITMDQTLKQYEGTFGFGSATGNLPFNGECVAGPCLANAPDPAPAQSNWRWVTDAWRNVTPKTRIRTRIGGGVYRLQRVRFRARGTSEAFGGPARARGTAAAQFIYVKERGRGAQRRVGTIRFQRLNGESFRSSGGDKTLVTTARTSSSPRGCQVWTRMWFTDRASGSDRAVLRFLGRCRIPGGRVRGIVFRDTANQRARVVIVPR